MQSVSSRIWTRVGVSISYDDNHYTTGTSTFSFYEGIFVKPDLCLSLAKGLGSIWHLCIEFRTKSVAVGDCGYINLFTWVSTWPSICMSWPMPWKREMVHNPGFLEVNFYPKCLGRFRETNFLCIYVVVYLEGNIFIKHKLFHQNISSFFCRIKLTDVEPVCF